MKKFQLSQTEEADSGEIGKIFYACASPVLTETKIIKGKILLKGDAVIKVMYCSPAGESESICMNYSLPFSEIVDIESIDDSSRVIVDFNIDQVQAEPKADNDGEYKYLNLACDICAVVTAYRAEDICVITDSYSTQRETDAKYKASSFTQVLQSLNDTVMCRESIDLSSMNPQRIYAAIAQSSEAQCRFDSGKMTLKGKIPLKFILIDGEGTPTFCEREASFEYSRSVDANGGRLCCDPKLFPTGYTCSLTGDGRAEFKAELSISAQIKETCECRTLVDLKASENTEPKKKHSSLVIRFCNGGEKVWDIARKYNTTVEDIMSENELTSEEIGEKMMLMIPVK